ncbi:imelysin family protein [Rubellimicrobium aerolatum]|uniref:Imelysin family protein n=1 Tax=Rubellimicrobium aerolatum TaxID=490979 RepID=A0ABW0SFQ0_9RHOB|nr:imelysin family protein [Rubellimicrobium aerolatum]MBP1807272.1 putative lipoprotein [Rubellimicrobium aerolatum]
MRLVLALLACCAGPAVAQERAEVIRDVVGNHVLPRYAALDEAAQDLDAAAQADCEPESPALREAYGEAFDAWIAASHLRFGPSEVEDRAYALAFWPDPRGDTPGALRALILEEDPVVGTAEGFAEVSIAARGFYGMEFMLYDEEFAGLGAEGYRCDLIRAQARDIALIAGAMQEEWTGGYADLMLRPGGDRYRSEADVIQEFYDALGAGLEFTADSRLARPMGEFDDPKPARAEARRSGRSLRHVRISLASLHDLAERLMPEGVVHDHLGAAFDRAETLAARLDDPVFAGVSDPTGRFRVEALKGAVDRISAVGNEELGAALGVAAGFNASDGD